MKREIDVETLKLLTRIAREAEHELEKIANWCDEIGRRLDGVALTLEEVEKPSPGH